MASTDSSTLPHDSASDKQHPVSPPESMTWTEELRYEVTHWASFQPSRVKEMTHALIVTSTMGVIHGAYSTIFSDQRVASYQGCAREAMRHVPRQVKIYGACGALIQSALWGAEALRGAPSGADILFVPPLIALCAVSQGRRVKISNLEWFFYTGLVIDYTSPRRFRKKNVAAEKTPEA